LVTQHRVKNRVNIQELNRLGRNYWWYLNFADIRVENSVAFILNGWIEFQFRSKLRGGRRSITPKKEGIEMKQKVILLADDDVDDAQLFCEALVSIDRNIICHCATDGMEALEVLQNVERPNIIFVDINMPRMNGWEFLRKIKCIDELKEIPVLVYSTSTQARDINTALDLGALCFFAKPNKFSELKNILEVVTNNLDENLLEAIGHFNYIKAKKVFACSDEES